MDGSDIRGLNHQEKAGKPAFFYLVFSAAYGMFKDNLIIMDKVSFQKTSPKGLVFLFPDPTRKKFQYRPDPKKIPVPTRPYTCIKYVILVQYRTL